VIGAASETLARLYRSRVLVWVLARRELKARYRGSALGYLWSLLNPLLLLAVYSIVFTIVFSPRGADIHPYPLFLFGGILAWNFFSGALLDASETFRANGPLLRKVIIAPEVFPGVSVAAQAIHFLLALPILVLATAYAHVRSGTPVGWPDVQIAPVMALLAACATGGALAVSAVSVRWRDLRDLLRSVLTFGFFASPIVYAIASLPVRLRPWARLNPAAFYFHALHESVFACRWIGAEDWIGMTVSSVLALGIGGAVFSRLRDSIAEEA
jgi:ABC-type polysaccharide/polyol phosphate export permease